MDFYLVVAFHLVHIVNVALQLLPEYDELVLVNVVFIWVNVVFILNQDKKLKG